ncbi:MAG TPA: hypothetical protein VJ992_06590 [Gemmatimonadales bacterium]|nr:hypothetical protein [Gemmatimonadales bacterium]
MRTASPRQGALKWALLVALALGLITIPVHAQGRGGGGRPLSVFGRQTLNFGTVLPGVPTTISRTDALNAGEFEVRGRKDTQVAIDLTLPAEMTAGALSLPLQFGPGDGGYSQAGTIAAATVFDPRVQLVTTLGANGRLYVYLGGTALPGPQQGAGTYSGTIVLTVAYTGV